MLKGLAGRARRFLAALPPGNPGAMGVASGPRGPGMPASRLTFAAIAAVAAVALVTPVHASAQSAPPAANRTATSAPRSPYPCEMVGGQRLEGSRVDVVFRPTPERINVGERFALSVLVCPHVGVTAPASVVVDAMLPERGHGMNYKPSVRSAYGGRQGFWYRAEGLMFHAAGRWELQIDVRAGGHTDRLRYAMMVE